MNEEERVKQPLLEIEQNINSRRGTDKIMWFSMWAVLSVASFGVAWFPMIYYLIKRRNAHFSRQEKLEKLILDKLEPKQNQERDSFAPLKTTNQLSFRKAKAWTVASLLVIPSFYIFYFLKSDLQRHEEHEHDFLVKIIALAKDKGLSLNIQGFVTSPPFSRDRYIILSVVTFGLAAAYWLYRIFNDYNSHFKMQWVIEDELLRFLNEIAQKTSF